MATAFTAARAATTKPVYQGPGGGAVNAAWGACTFDTDVTLAAALTVTGCRIPANATVIGGMVYGPDIDTGTEAFDFDIGWTSASAPTCHAGATLDATDTDGFGNLGVQSGDAITEWKPVAGIMVPFQGVLLVQGPITFTAEAAVTLLFNADANAGGTGTVSVVVYYVTP
jgi:hypothetical protein